MHESEEEKADKYGAWKKNGFNEREEDQKVILEIEKKLKQKNGTMNYAISLSSSFLLLAFLI